MKSSRLFIVVALLSIGLVRPAAAQTWLYGSNGDGIYRINPATAATTPVYTGAPFPTTLQVAALAIRSADGMLFFLVSDASSNDQVYRWDPNTPASPAVLLGTTGVGVPWLLRLAFSPSGTLYAADVATTGLYTINTTTGAATLVGPLTGGVAAGGDLAFTAGGALFQVSRDGANDFVYSVPPSAGAMSIVGTITGFPASPSGTAIDAAGQVFLETSQSNDLYRTTLAGGAAVLVGSMGVGLADLAMAPSSPPSIAKGFAQSPIAPGQSSTLTITLSNVNPNPQGGAAFVDTYPAGLVNATSPSVTNTCGGTVTATGGGGSISLTGGTIPAAGSCTITVQVTSASAGSYVNTIPAGGLTTVIGTNPSDATATLVVNPSADLSITKTDGVSDVALGSTMTYTIVASNLGPTAVTGASVADVFPAGLTGVTWLCAASAGSACPASGSGNISATIDLLVGGTATFTAIGTASVAGPIANTATVTPPTGVTDPTPSNNTATDNTLVIAIDAVNDPLVTLPSSGGTVPTVITNDTVNGQPAVIGTNIAIPTVVSNGGITGLVMNADGTLTVPPGTAPGNYTVTYQICSLAIPTVCDTATVPVTIGTPSADLGITKTDGTTTVTAGGSTTYTIVVSNAGPNAVVGATVTDVAPAGVTFGTWTCVASAGSACPASGSGNLSATVDVLAGGTATFTVPATIAPTATGVIANTATVAPPAGVTDPNPGNNSATDTDTVTTAADVTVTKTDGTSTVTAGGSTIYTIVVSNLGPSAVLGATVTDTAPATLTFGNWTCVASAGSSCPGAGTGNLSVTVDLLAGGTATFTVPATILPSASGTIVNTVTVTPPSGVTDPNPGNNTATDVDTVTPAVAVADLGVSKSDGVATIPAGGATTYVVVITNAGPAPAPGTTVTDPVAAGLTKTGVSCAAAGGAVCPASTTVPSLESGLVIPDLPSGGSVTLTVTATVTASSGAVTNTVSVQPPPGVTDPNPANNTASDTDTVAGGTPVADLSVTKTDGVSDVAPGSSIVYTVVAANAGPSAVTGATLTDSASSGLTLGAWTCTASPGSSCPASGTGLLQVTVSLLAGGSATFTISASVANGASGSITNGVTIAPPPGVTDPVSTNNSASDTDTITPPRIDVEKRAGTPVVVGPTAFDIPYTIVVTNSGRIRLTNVQAWDSLSTAFAAGSPAISLSTSPNVVPGGGATAAQCAVNPAFTGIGPAPSAQTNLFTGATHLDEGQNCRVAFTVRVTYPNIQAIPRGPLVNRVEATSSGGSTVDESEATVVLRLPRVDITKALTGVSQVGDEPAFDLSFAFVVRSTGDVAAPNVQVTDDLSAVFTAGSPSITIQAGPTLGPGTAPLTLAAGASAFNGTTRPALLTGTDTMAPGSERTILFTARIRFASTSLIPSNASFANTATTATSVNPGGPVISTDSSTDATQTNAPPSASDLPAPTSISFTPRVQLAVQKVASRRVVELGDTVTYAVRVVNLSGATLPTTTLTDELPLGFSYVPGSSRLLSGLLETTVLGEPTGSPGPVLTFAIPAQPVDAVTVTYRVRVGAGALQGSGVNSAVASTSGTSPVRSNVARAAVVVSGGVFAPEGCVIGKVFADLNGNGLQDAEPSAEPGVPGVFVTLEDGTGMVSDVEGKYSYCGLTPTTHVVKVDRTTLPPGAVLTVGSHRNALDPGSIFVDVKYGEVRRADFVVSAADAAVLGHISDRRQRGEVWTPIFENGPDRPLGDRPSESNRPVPIQVGPMSGSADVVLGSSAKAADVVAADDSLRQLRFVTITGAPLTSRTSTLPDEAPRSVDPTAPRVGSIRLAADRAAVTADGRSPVRLTITAVDADGQPLAGTIDALVEVTGGRLRSADRSESGGLVVDGGVVVEAGGTRVRLDNGRADIDLVAPSSAGDVRVRVTAGEATVEGVVTAEPHLRPLLAVGLVEGMVALSAANASAVEPLRAAQAFERELTRFAVDFGDDQHSAGGRAALFLKGTVKGEYLLTLAYDSEKDPRGVLFRDIQPDAFYPVYGDASLKTFDAQTSGRFYLRAERGRSYLIYGDLQSAALVPAAQNLGTYNRSLTGLQHHFENRYAMLNLFASRDTLRQVVDELGGLGISGPYTLSHANGVTGSEKVEIVTRDRQQPAVILNVVPLTRFTDYEFEPFSGRLLFRRPVSALDEHLNPMSIRVTYEVDEGGEKSWVGGVNGQLKLGRFAQLGGSFAEDRAEDAPYRLSSVNATLRVGASTVVVAETARSRGSFSVGLLQQRGLTSQPGALVDGAASRVELRHESARASARLFAGTSEATFHNPAATLNGGRTEMGGRATARLGDAVRVVGEAIRSEDELTNGRRNGAYVGLDTRVRQRWALELGLRRSKESVQAAQGTTAGVLPFGSTSDVAPGAIDPVTGLPVASGTFGPTLTAGPGASFDPIDVLSLRGKATASVTTAVNVYGEIEQDLRDADKKLAAVGAQVQMTERMRAYLRHEFLSSLGSAYGLSSQQRNFSTVFGVSSSYFKHADVFSEYRLRDAVSGRDAQAAIGLRNLWSLGRGVDVSTGIERLHTIAGVEQEATAATFGVSHTRSQLFKATGRLEWRRDGAGDRWLSTMGVARKLSADWTMLAKNYYQRVDPKTGRATLQNRLWLGGAYRDTSTNRLNLLSRYEYRFEDTLGAPVLGGSRRDVQSVSTHVDWHPTRPWTLSGQHAAKFVSDRTDAVESRYVAHLLSGRAGRDVSERVDLGLLGSVMWSPEVGGRRYAVGGEVGFLVYDNMWLSAGYNVTGFTDRDMVGSHQTARGGFVRFRVKFDEGLFGSRDR